MSESRRGAQETQLSVLDEQDLHQKLFLKKKSEKNIKIKKKDLV